MFGNYAYGQKTFAPIGATWYYTKIENNIGSEGYVKVVSERDTTIEGKASKILSQTYYKSSGDIEIRDNFYVYQNGDTVFYWINNAFRVVYIFSLDVGDTMEIYSNEIEYLPNENYSGSIKVDNVDDITINDNVLKRITTSPIDGSIYEYQGPFIEVIGSIYGLFAIDGSIMDNHLEIGSLRCYSDSQIGQYQVSNNIPCDRLINITDIPEAINTNFSVKYSPADETVYFNVSKLELSDKVSVTVYDLMGRKIAKHSFRSDNGHINLSRYLDGVYIIKIITNKKVIYHEKIYKY